MPLLTRLMSAGASALLAKEICGTESTITAAGTGQSTAAPLLNTVNNVSTVAAGTGVILPANLNVGESVAVFNSGANILAIFPPVGGNINGGSTNAPVELEVEGYLTFTCTTAGLGFSAGVSTDSFGSGDAIIGPAGNVNVQAPGVAGAVNPGATGADNVLAVYSLPANSLDVANRMLEITAWGEYAANTNTKTVKLWFNATTAVVGSTITGGTLIDSTGAVTTSGGGWRLSGSVVKRGAAGSNTQTVLPNPSGGASIVAEVTPQDTTATESGAILIAVTGNAATTATDIGLAALQVKAFD